ncbi:MAG: 2-hydroxyacid dehydrogenase [Alphaproteobacteria bacterium]
MTLLFFSEVDRVDWWTAELNKAAPDIPVRAWPDFGDPAAIRWALVWKPRHGLLASLPNLKLILSMGAGVDHIFADPTLPRGVPVTRIVDPMLTAGIAEYVLLHVLRYHRFLPALEAQQRERVWKMRFDLHRLPSERRVGILGMGVMGADAAAKLAALGFDVAGWSRTKKRLPGVASFHGADGLAPFLARTDILVCLLPLTPATTGILCAANLAHLPDGAFVINAGRGGHVVDVDLLAALDAGKVAHATLDVFHSEPLPQDHPFWTHPRVTVTPHNAAISDPRSIVSQVVDNIRRFEAGRPLVNLVDTAQGY